MTQSERKILIAGAGIAGLTAALAFAAKGYNVSLFERAQRLEEFGAGLQISPNATRILARLGVLENLMQRAIRPDSVTLVEAETGRELTSLPLGDAAQARWGSSYLVAHRADLQAALLASVAANKNIEITTGARICGADPDMRTVTLEWEGAEFRGEGSLFVAADGVWSSLRGTVRKSPESRFSGYVAWRATVDAGHGKSILGEKAGNRVTAFLSPNFHLVVYPLRGGQQINLVAVVAGSGLAEKWIVDADASALRSAFKQTSISQLGDPEIGWTAWPLHEVDAAGSWSDGKFTVLAGDAAHAMTPFGAQGAAMAIEDGFVLAGCVSKAGGDIGAALRAYETIRKPRVERVIKRGAFNRFTWHAAGPVALARNLVLRTRPGASLMADFDWLYGYDAEADI